MLVDPTREEKGGTWRVNPFSIWDTSGCIISYTHAFACACAWKQLALPFHQWKASTLIYNANKYVWEWKCVWEYDQSFLHARFVTYTMVNRYLPFLSFFLMFMLYIKIHFRIFDSFCFMLQPTVFKFGLATENKMPFRNLLRLSFFAKHFVILRFS